MNKGVFKDFEEEMIRRSFYLATVNHFYQVRECGIIEEKIMCVFLAKDLRMIIMDQNMGNVHELLEIPPS